MLSDFTKKKETFFYHFQKQSFSKTKGFKGLTHAFNQTWLIFSLFTIDQKKKQKTRNNSW